MKINLGETLTRRVLLTPDREALVCEDVRRTFAELNARTNKLANAMKALGIGHGDRVAMLAFNEPEYYEMFYGLGKIGAILVPINYRLAGPEMQFIISDCAPKAMVVGPEYVEIVDSIRNDIPVKDYVVLSDTPPAWAQSYETLTGGASDEEPELIGGDISVTSADPEIVSGTVEAVRKINKSAKILCGAGVKNGKDVAKAIELGAEGVLLASGVVKAKDTISVLKDLASGCKELTIP